MSKRAIYSYIFLNNFWKGHPDVFFDLAKLSVNLAKKHYDDVILYTNRDSEIIFQNHGITFDKIEYISDFDDITEYSYGLSKIKAMIDQTDPYVILDLDTLVFERINTTHTVSYGYTETKLKDVSDFNYINEYYITPYNNIHERIDVNLRWDTFPNNSFVDINNPIIVNRAYEKILDIIDGIDFTTDNELTVQFYEQFLLFNLLNNWDVDVGFLYSHNTFSSFDFNDGDIDYLISKKFIHIDSYHKDTEKLKGLIDKIKLATNG